MILATMSDLSLVFAIPMCFTRQPCYEDVKWKLAADVIFCHIICTWHLGWSVNIVERLQCLNIFIFGYLFQCLWIYNFGK